MGKGFGQEKQFKTNYEKIGKVGGGGYGIVFTVRDKRDGKECAIKIVSVSESDQRELNQIKFEVLLQKDKLKHPNIVKYDDCWMEDLDSLPEDITNNLKLVFGYRDDGKLPYAICICMKMKLYEGKYDYSFTDLTFVY